MPQLRAHNRKMPIRPPNVLDLVKTPIADETLRRAAIRDALAEIGEVIYAITCEDGLIKIGHTTDLRHRRSQHGVAFQDVVAVMPGSYEDEQAIHRSLRAHVARGREYYHPHPDVIDFVNDIRSRAGVAPIELKPAV